MTDTLSHLVHTVRPKTGPRIILPLGIALSAALAPGQDLPKPSIIPNLPGALYTAADPMAFTVKLSAALTDHGATSTVTVVIANIAGKTMETVAALELSPNNNYTATVQPSTLGLGYYSVTASLPAKPGSNSKQSSLSFGIIPDVGLKGPQPASPFGVVTHYRRWRRDELPALQAKLGISWFREEMDFRECAEKDQVSPLLILAEQRNLTWLPLINYVDANRGVEVEGTWRWDDDLARLKRAFEIHQGRLHVYESQNEPNNFGNWTKRFKGPASPWLADNWGKPFSDLVKAMKQTLSAVDPQAKLLWPDLDSPAWIHAFASKWGAAPFVDGVAPHPYSLHGQLPETQEYVRGAKDYLAMLDLHHIPRNVWVTEVGYTTYQNPAYRKGTVAYQPLTEPQQAAWLVRVYLSHLGWGVSRIFWYDLMDDGNDEKECEHRFGLFHHNSLTPKPAAIAYANLIHEARDSRWIAPCKLAGIPQANAFAFACADAATCMVAAWMPEGASDLRLPSSTVVTDIFGAVLEPRDGLLTLTDSPVYIHGLGPQGLDLGERVNLGTLGSTPKQSTR